MKEPYTAFLPWQYGDLYRDLVCGAREAGYCLALHGSMSRDLDLVAIPWTDEALSAEELAELICAEAGATFGPREVEVKPHGRLAWSLHLGGGPYIDLSVMPRGGSLSASPAEGKEAAESALAASQAEAAGYRAALEEVRKEAIYALNDRGLPMRPIYIQELCAIALSQPSAYAERVRALEKIAEHVRARVARDCGDCCLRFGVQECSKTQCARYEDAVLMAALAALKEPQP